MIDGPTLLAQVSWQQAIDSIAAQLSRLAGEPGTPRTSTPVRTGELLIMPAESPAAVGVKIAAVAPGNARSGRPRIQAVYVLFDADTLTPLAVIDGAALTYLRTPAQSAVAVRYLAVPGGHRLVVFGAGPQALGHVHALRAVRPVDSVTVVGRDPTRAEQFVEQLGRDGVPARRGTADSVADADIVVCATTARTPLFDGGLLADHACVIAVGSHEPGARELDGTVFRRASRVVVEGWGAALREAGDVLLAISDGAMTIDRLVEIAELPTLPAIPGIGVFKGVGAGWQDLAVAEVAYAAWRRSNPDQFS